MMDQSVQITVTMAGLVVFIREAAWFIRTLKGGHGPQAEMKDAMKELTKTLQEMNRKLDDNHHISDRIHDKVSDIFTRRP